MKVLTTTLLFTILLTSWDCNVLYSYDNSKEVFIGTVIMLQLTGNKSKVVATVDVQKIYKEDETHKLDTLNNVEVQSYFRTAEGYDWELGETYLIFVESIENQYRIVNMCSLTKKIKGYEYNEDTGEWIGTPSLKEVKEWRVNGNEKWNQN